MSSSGVLVVAGSVGDMRLLWSSAVGGSVVAGSAGGMRESVVAWSAGDRMLPWSSLVGGSVVAGPASVARLLWCDGCCLRMVMCVPVAICP